MHHQMMWGHHRSFGDAFNMDDIPTIPAPIAMCTLVAGLMIGMMVGRKKAMMHGGMMGGMGHGYGYQGDWMHKKAMMYGGMYGKGMYGKGMYGHHHHGHGMPPCDCNEPETHEGAETEKTETA